MKAQLAITIQVQELELVNKRQLNLQDLVDKTYNSLSIEVKDLFSLLASELNTTKTRVMMLEEEIYDYKKKLAKYR